MNRIAIRTTCAFLALTATLGVLYGTAALAKIQSAAPQLVVLLPHIEVTAPAAPQTARVGNSQRTTL